MTIVMKKKNRKKKTVQHNTGCWVTSKQVDYRDPS